MPRVESRVTAGFCLPAGQNCISSIAVFIGTSDSSLGTHMTVGSSAEAGDWIAAMTMVISGKRKMYIKPISSR